MYASFSQHSKVSIYSEFVQHVEVIDCHAVTRYYLLYLFIFRWMSLKVSANLSKWLLSKLILCQYNFF